jgi:hypothetical protein
MKMLNLIFSIFFGILSGVAFIVSFFTNSFDTTCIGIVLGAISYIAYQEYKHPLSL